MGYGLKMRYAGQPNYPLCETPSYLVTGPGRFARHKIKNAASGRPGEPFFQLSATSTSRRRFLPTCKLLGPLGDESPFRDPTMVRLIPSRRVGFNRRGNSGYAKVFPVTDDLPNAVYAVKNAARGRLGPRSRDI